MSPATKWRQLRGLSFPFYPKRVDSAPLDLSSFPGQFSMARIRFAMAAGLLCLLCGCRTTNNLVMMHYHRPSSNSPADYELIDYVYGGVKFDLNAVQSTFTTEEIPLQFRLFGPLFLADLPLSLVCDTLNLPITIPATQREVECARRASETNADVGDSSSVSPVTSTSER